MKKLLVLTMLFGFGIFLSSCGGAGTEQTQNAATNEEPAQQQVQDNTPSPLEAQLALGKQIFDTKCIVCHMADAKGVKGAFPPLANSDYLLADPKRGLHQTLNGSNEEMIVNGETYKAPMTPQVTTKEEAVAVINYVLKHFNGYTDDQLLKIEDAADIEINPMKL